MNSFSLQEVRKEKNIPKRDIYKRDVPTPLKVGPVTPLSKYIHVGPSPKPVPITTSSMIGWRSSKEGLKLEKYGKYSRPKGGLIKQLNWPAEAIS